MFARSLLRSNAALSYSCNALTQLFKSGAVTCRTATVVRPVSCSACRYQELDPDSEEAPPAKKFTTHPSKEGSKGYKPRNVDVQDSIRYIESEAYSDVYRNEPVWKPYRRNKKHSLYVKPRISCIRGGVVSTASPCPICRDDYLIFDYRNLKLLNQFISDTDGEPLNIRMTGLCLTQMKRLKLEVAKAQDYGLLEKHFPVRSYNYDHFKKRVQNEYVEQTGAYDDDTNVNHSTSS